MDDKMLEVALFEDGKEKFRFKLDRAEQAPIYSDDVRWYCMTEPQVKLKGTAYCPHVVFIMTLREKTARKLGWVWYDIPKRERRKR